MRAEAPAWAARYIGVPFVDLGRTLDGCDCYGLGRLIMRERCGIEIPDVTGYEGTDKEDAETCARLHAQELGKGDWLPITPGNERSFDWIVVRVLGMPWHYAVVLEPGIAVHTMSPKQGSVLLRYKDRRYHHVVSQPGQPVPGSGFYRHRLMAG